MPTEESSTWISGGEKYAFVGLAVNFLGSLPSGQLTTNLSVLFDEEFRVPSHWRDWLGSIRVEEIESCNLFLLSKLASATPGVLDAENQILHRRIWYFYVGLLLASTFVPAHEPVMLTGARIGGEIDVRQQQHFDLPIGSIHRPYPALEPDNIRYAAHIGESFEALVTRPPPGGTWRLFRTVTVYREARTTEDILDRIHRYCRCIDGLTMPNPGKTKQQFKSRTELFIGATHHNLMGELYDVRSAAEHLHENRYLGHFDRKTRLELARKEAIIGHIARTSLARVVTTDSLWLHFANASALEAFWALAPAKRREIWGKPIDPLEAIAGFDSDEIEDAQLGG